MLSRCDRRVAVWLSGHHVCGLESKMQVNPRWEQGWAVEMLPLCDKYMGKPELSWQLWLVKDVKSNKKSFCRDVGSKKRPKENTDSLLNVWDSVTKGVESIFFYNEREVNLCLELLSGVITGCMLMILVYFSLG